MAASMAVGDTLAGLARFPRRGAGTDAERRAATWLARELMRARFQTRLQTFWCRPNWALAHAWHVALALAGSLVAVGSARVGGALILVALLSLIADAVTGISLGRRVTPEHASQNVIGTIPGTAPVRLIITSNYDAGRTGLIYRPSIRRLAASVRRRLGPLALGWLAWLALMMVWLEATAVARLEGSRGTAIGLAQLLPTVVLVLAFALLLEHGTSGYGPAATDNASGTAAAVALARAVSVSPPLNAQLELVLQGAGDGGGLGLRSYLRAHRSALRPAHTVVLGIAPCGGGIPCWWVSDGQLVPLGYFDQLRRLAEDVAAGTEQLGARAHRGRGWSPALPARSRSIPALSLGALDAHGLSPHSHDLTDTFGEVDLESVQRLVEFGLLLVDAVDDFLGRRAAASGALAPGAGAAAETYSARPA